MAEPSPGSGNEAKSPPAKKCIIFGIDFGTTYTGVAWAWTGQPEDVFTITNWESQLYGNEEREKCPTAINYKPEGSTWGYAIPLTEQPFQWFKLLLLNENDLADHLRDSPQLARARQMLKESGKDPVEVIADYLRHLWSHALGNVRRSMGKRPLDKTPFHVVITIPAIWKTYALARMRQAARQAGILADRPCGPTILTFITEPEAAALATFSDMRRRPDIEVGDAFVVTDCGGGTVDIISYEVVNANPLEVKECVEGTGALCGGVFLDQDFEALLRMRIGKETWDKIPRHEIQKTMDTAWEHGIKQQFDGRPRNWPVDLPPQCAKGGRFPRIELKSGHIEEVFENVISQIEGLVGQQFKKVNEKLKQPPKYVILVGGFGRCRFLYERLSILVGDQSDVLQGSGPAPWTAVCRGAVLSALTSRGLLSHSLVQVSSRISRASFGTESRHHFNESIHLLEDREYCNIETAYFARRQMNWFLVRGDKVLEKEQTKVEYYNASLERNMDLNSHFKVGIPIFSCEDLIPPGRKDPKSTTIKQLCTIQVRSPIPSSQLPVKDNLSGEKLRFFNYTIEMISHGASVEFSVNFEGQRIASQYVDVLFEKDPVEPERPVSSLLRKSKSFNQSMESLRERTKPPLFPLNSPLYDLSELSIVSGDSSPARPYTNGRSPLSPL
ncbi:actin-like ATPase domain-containing protein [Hypoxylon trugodes]|uniref:actin-like ATPase domain-containing protein n=1 Tax=Hypoxylon trugodes TaxID=326681 RepID=UPI00218CE6D8|nr:actin-like ATPase domain-containing protein [Hypoxylon trugodes]KAI1386328.1 actin-like ATPase domain-containing protein [Hypoxylon trugodes]